MKFINTVVVLGTATFIQFLLGTTSFSAPNTDQPAKATEQTVDDAVRRLQAVLKVAQKQESTQTPPAATIPDAAPAAEQNQPTATQGTTPITVTLPPAKPSAPAAPAVKAPAVSAPKDDEKVVTLDPTGKLSKKPDLQTAQKQYQADKKAADKKTVKKPSPPALSKNDQIREALDKRKAMMARAAMSFRGTPYVWGGSSPRAFDCSGFTQYLYKTQHGISLPHNAKMQFKRGKAVNFKDLQTGDLVFFNTRGPITHVGMYIGNGNFIHAANPRRGVRVDKVTAGYYKKVYAGARRYL